jgi:signal transduction histidine kinase
VREIARAHGGDAVVDSSDADGTTFVVTLPRKQAPSSSDD